MATVTDPKTGSPIYSTPGVGRNQVGAYQVSGTPWITGSATLSPGMEDTITFPNITQTVVIKRMDSSAGTLRAHFNATGSGDVVAGKHYLDMPNLGDGWELDVKCTQLYVSCPTGGTAREYFVIATLTTIDDSGMGALTGSGLTD